VADGFDADGLALGHGTRRTSTLMVMGPQSRTLLGRLTDDDLSRESAPWMSVRDLTVAGVGVTGLRVSFVGELGWELHVDDADLVGLYEALSVAGADLGLRDFGSYALNSMRVEKAYHGWGSEFGPEYTPFEAGLDRFVAVDDPDKGNFVGRDAVLRRSGEQPAWSYVVLTLDADAHAALPGRAADPAPSAPIRVDGQVCGFATSSATGFRTGHRVVLGYVEGSAADQWDGFSVDVLGTSCSASRHEGAIYDPDHHRPRS
jgi:dimethylglycine dehydrogenase